MYVYVLYLGSCLNKTIPFLILYTINSCSVLFNKNINTYRENNIKASTNNNFHIYIKFELNLLRFLI